PSAISTSSTPWSSAYTNRRAARAARTACSPAVGSNDASSSSVRGREAANSAASSSFARDCTRDHHRAEWFRLRERERAALGELEQRDKRREYVHQRCLRTNGVLPTEDLPLRQQRRDAGRGSFDVERARHHTVQHRLGDERDDALRG